MQIICKFPGGWTILNKEKGTSRLLTQQQIEVIEELFDAELEKPARYLDALKVEKFPANKLQQITVASQSAFPAGKQIELPGKPEVSKAA